MAVDEISAEKALETYADESERVAWIDVRSEKEFLQGHLPDTDNVPILRDAERHQVGLTYKTRGQEAAICLGHQLVDPEREARVDLWRACFRHVAATRGWVMCWRGGLRSQIASEWMSSAGLSVQRITGGYKAVRRVLLDHLVAAEVSFVLGGYAGSGKSELLARLKCPVLDLEKWACHRGSAFGLRPREIQPSQATFENRLGFEIFRTRASHFLVEDESSFLGSVHVPEELYRKMSIAALVILEIPLEQRVERVFDDYVRTPLKGGIPHEELQKHLENNLKKMSRRLGDERFRRIGRRLRESFREGGESMAIHAAWIQELLEGYYDPLYAYSLRKMGRKIAFRGDFEECLAWLSNHRKLY